MGHHGSKMDQGLPKPRSETLRMHYVGSFKQTGEIFDSSKKAGQPIGFQVGMRQAREWEGIGGKRWTLLPLGDGFYAGDQRMG